MPIVLIHYRNWIFTHSHRNRSLRIWKEYVLLAIRLLISLEVISRQIIKQNSKDKVWIYFLYKILLDMSF